MCDAGRIFRGCLPLIVSALALHAGCSRSTPPRHLVLITLDTLRSDRLGAYGYERGITPSLDGLAARGVRFDDALAQSISTPPSHASILTGLNPPSHGLRLVFGQSLPADNVTLAEILREAGFTTAAFVSGPPLHRCAGLDQGFDVYDDQYGEAPGGGRAEQTDARVLKWLEERPQGRLFLWVHYFDPHAPYCAPSASRGRPGSAKCAHVSVNANQTGELRPAPGTTARTIDSYDAEVGYLDSAIGELLAALDDAALLDEAVVAVVADHGEHLGEYGYFFGHYDVLEETAQVPLILVHPSGRWAGEVVEAPVATIDLMPTLLRWLGVDSSPEREGRDLTPLIEGEPVEDRTVYTEQLEYFDTQALRSDRFLVVTRGQHRAQAPGLPGGTYARRGSGRYALDATAASETTERFQRELLAIRKRARAPGQPPVAVPETVVEQLRALGYVGGAAD